MQLLAEKPWKSIYFAYDWNLFQYWTISFWIAEWYYGSMRGNYGAVTRTWLGQDWHGTCGFPATADETCDCSAGVGPTWKLRSTASSCARPDQETEQPTIPAFLSRRPSTLSTARPKIQGCGATAATLRQRQGRCRSVAATAPIEMVILGDSARALCAPLPAEPSNATFDWLPEYCVHCGQE